MEKILDYAERLGYECIESTECVFDAVLLKCRRTIVVNPDTITKSTMRDILCYLCKEAAFYGKVS